jgi:hypothetical protein
VYTNILDPGGARKEGEGKGAKNVANLIYLDGEVIFVSASKYFLCVCKIQIRDYSLSSTDLKFFDATLAVSKYTPQDHKIITVQETLTLCE